MPRSEAPRLFWRGLATSLISTASTSQASEGALVQHQRALIEHVRAMRSAIDGMQDPEVSLERCCGLWDSLLPPSPRAEPASPSVSFSESTSHFGQPPRFPTPPWALPARCHRLSTTSVSSAATSLASAGSGLGSALAAGPFPAPSEPPAAPRPPSPTRPAVAIAAGDRSWGDALARSLQPRLSPAFACWPPPPHAHAPGPAPVSVCPTLRDAALSGAPVVVLCVTPGAVFRDDGNLLSQLLDGAPSSASAAAAPGPRPPPRGAVVVGDVDPETHEAIFERFCGDRKSVV